MEDNYLNDEDNNTAWDKDLQDEKDESKETVASVREALEKKEAECRDLQDKYVRTLAEMDNFRKRINREMNDAVKFANDKILGDLLVVIDNMERAIAHSREKKDFDSLLDGLELTMKEFRGVFEKHGVQSIESVGQLFDPSRHHAVAMVESDSHGDNVIVEEFRKGYLLNDRVLRHSLVSVAKKKNGEQQ
ncbi:MAG: nucleotide exchange factor GrpE [Nitrospirae bacterium]|nr:nucleotide exchange factor GrpE [Nitrospirota bacterium]